MANINSKPKSQQSHGRNGFDLSFHRSFTAPCGMLLPVAKDFAYAGEKYRLGASSFIRTQPMQTAAFMRLKAHFEWFFVPIQQLFSLWRTFYYGTNDIMSSVFYPDDESESRNGTPIPLHNLTPFISNPQIFTPSPQGSRAVTDEFSVPLADNFRRLWDLFGYGSLTQYVSQLSQYKNYQLTLFDFLAYHKIFHSHYNVTEWLQNSPKLYNVDKYFSTHSVPQDVTKKIISTIHYRPWRKDFFTNIFPSPVFNNKFADYLNNGIYTDSANINQLMSPESAYGSETSVGLNSDLISLRSDASDNHFNLSDIRTAYAFDKLCRITASTGCHYDQQTLAHLGVKVPEGIAEEAYYLGGSVTDITIGEVVSTATTNAKGDNNKPLQGNTLGDIAGKGFGLTQGSKDITFEAPCEGIIMCIFSIEPLPDYASMGCDPQNLYKDFFDFWRPELDNLGMQPLQTSYFNVANSNSQSGWQYRFSELKQRFDVVNEGFWDTDKTTWVGYRQSSPVVHGVTGQDVNTFFFIPPTYTNSIFYSNFGRVVTDASSSDWNDVEYRSISVYSGDNFMIDADFKIYKTSQMSVFSLPNF